ncbi:MAG: glycosyltransferase [Proteobacteria bacterium]|nr:glycosyltransferase [Pseudomonadota bacterium]
MISNKNFPKITIITPVKNAVTTLEKAIESLIRQNYPNLEYIIIDGASTDGTLDIIKKYENNISYWQSSDDGSNIIAHNEGIKKASGEIIAFLNADDFYEAETLKKVGEAFKENPELDIVSTRFRAVKNGKIVAETNAEDATMKSDQLLKIPGMNARFFKKDLFYKYGFPLTEDNLGRVFISNDLEYLIRFTLKGVKNQVLNHVGYNYVMHDDSLTFSKKSDSKIRLYEDRIFIAKKFLNSNEFNLPKIWRKTFKKWIKKYRAKIVVGYFKEKKFSELRKNLILGIKESGFLKFIFYILKSLLRNQEKTIGF